MPSGRSSKPANAHITRKRLTQEDCLEPLSEIPLDAMASVALHHLLQWVDKGISPPHAPRVIMDMYTVNDGSLMQLDEYGNAKGGIRNVWVDVPTATNGVFGKGKTPAQDRLCQLAGTKVPLPDATLKTLYPSKSAYVTKVRQRLDQLVAQGWFLPEYVDTVRRDADAMPLP